MQTAAEDVEGRTLCREEAQLEACHGGLEAALEMILAGWPGHHVSWLHSLYMGVTSCSMRHALGIRYEEVVSI